MLNQEIREDFAGGNGQDAEYDEQEEKMEAPADDYENDPYFASAIEFMYSEDTEDDFGTLDLKQ